MTSLPIFDTIFNGAGRMAFLFGKTKARDREGYDCKAISRSNSIFEPFYFGSKNTHLRKGVLPC